MTRTPITPEMLSITEGPLYAQWDPEGLEQEILFAYLVTLSFPDGRAFEHVQAFPPEFACRAREARAAAQALLDRVAAHGSVNLSGHWVEVPQRSSQELAEAEFERECREDRHPYAA